MTEICDCGLPFVPGEFHKCEIRVLEESKGSQAASRVMRYATLWDRIGNIFNILNIVSAVILGWLIIFLSGFEMKFKILSLFGLAILLGISYLQISLIRGIASYFQMRSMDYLENRESN
jgi:hypothetical protein